MPRPKTQAEFISDARAVHGDAFDYSRIVYTGSKNKVTLNCPVHGGFMVSPDKHLSGAGCPACGVSRRAAKRRTTTVDIVAQFKTIHGDRYDYSLVHHTNVDNKVSIICRVHGEFLQSPGVHSKGHGCPVCAAITRGLQRKDTALSFAAKARLVHGSAYAYGAYVDSQTPTKIVCRAHGDFYQSPANHIQGSGCPQCARQVSRAEVDIMHIVRDQGFEAINRYRPSWMNGKELDVFVPEHNLAIEYCGAHVHNSTRHVYGHQPKDKWYHYDKWKTCRDNGVTLLTIYDFEWMSHREKWEAVISHKLQKADRRVYARKCKIVPVEREVAHAFCREHHIEGVGGMWLRTSECRGLEYQGELVAVSVCEEGDIKRSCTKSGIAVIGGVSKLFKSFPAGTTMMTTNNTGSSGNYGTLVEKKTLRYWWVKLGTEPKAFPRRQCQKHMLEKRFGQPVGDKTERQYMEDLGYVKCYDSGLSYWVNA